MSTPLSPIHRLASVSCPATPFSLGAHFFSRQCSCRMLAIKPPVAMISRSCAGQSVVLCHEFYKPGWATMPSDHPRCTFTLLYCKSRRWGLFRLFGSNLVYNISLLGGEACHCCSAEELLSPCPPSRRAVMESFESHVYTVIVRLAPPTVRHLCCMHTMGGWMVCSSL